MQRFYIPDIDIQEGALYSLETPEIVFQLTKVLRSQLGDFVIVFDGRIYVDYICEIIEIKKKTIQLKCREKKRKDSDCPIDITLYQAIPNKFEKIEYILQKGVEVGIKKFVFYRSERSQKCNISENKKERLAKIVREALEQSGGNSLPTLLFDVVGSTQNIVDSLNEDASEYTFFCHTDENNSHKLHNFISKENNKKIKKINIFVGPEGGFSDTENILFDQKKCIRLYLGKNILRTETVGVVVAFFFLQSLL